ncbi:MAG: ATP-binding cassette domain-containing protein [Candidatus Dojkabacteria bacterium]
MSIITVDNLIKKYRKSQENAVDGISFDVKEGELFAFLGPNGAGKTTTISILTTTLSKTSGTVIVDGLDIAETASEVRQRVGIIFQKPSLDENLSAEENIRFHSVLYGLYSFSPSYRLMPKAYKNKVQELAEVVGIGDSLNNPVKQFSGGMKRKLEIIRSLMHSPKILFLDEPTIGLDPDSRNTLWEYLLNMKHKTGMTVFLTTHYLDEVEEADTVCIINKGKIVANGSPQSVKDSMTQETIVFETQPDDVQQLKDEVTSRGYEAEVKGNKVIVKVREFEKIKNLMNAISTNIADFDVHKPSMEDAYLQIIREEAIDI